MKREAGAECVAIVSTDTYWPPACLEIRDLRAERGAVSAIQPPTMLASRRLEGVSHPLLIDRAPMALAVLMQSAIHPATLSAHAAFIEIRQPPPALDAFAFASPRDSLCAVQKHLAPITNPPPTPRARAIVVTPYGSPSVIQESGRSPGRRGGRRDEKELHDEI
jgi:hypothetical protein